MQFGPKGIRVNCVSPGQVSTDLWLGEHGYEVVTDLETAQYAGGKESVPRSQLGSMPLDLVIVLGGDGTLLSAARATATIDVPLLGVNLGSLGFLTEVPPQSLYTMLDAIAQGRAAVEHRVLMECTLLRGDEVRGNYLVFNDAVVNKTTLARLNTYDLFIDSVFVSNVLHSHGPDQNRSLLAKIHDCLNPGGQLILRDVFMSHDRVAPEWATLFSVLLLLQTPQGRCYALAEVRGWLRQAGFAKLKGPFRSSSLFFDPDSILIATKS